MADESATERKLPNYYLIWVYLLILTVVEVFVAFMSQLPETVLIIALLVLAVWKAALVAMYYMHLRLEPPRLIVMIIAAFPLAILLTLTVLMEGF